MILMNSKKRFQWDQNKQVAFDLVKEKIQERIVLVPFRKGAKLSLYTDASKVAAGAVLLQDGLPLEFWSRRFTDTEKAYSTNEREALALVDAVLHFQTILQGVEYTAYTDHAALTRWLDNRPVNDRHARWMTKVQHLIHDIQYVPGDLNVLADLMSRPRGLLRYNNNDVDEEDQGIINALYNDGELHFVNAVRNVDMDLSEDDIQEENDDNVPQFDCLKFRKRQKYRDEQNQSERRRRNAMIPTIRKLKPAGNAPPLKDSDSSQDEADQIKKVPISKDDDKPKSKRQLKKELKQKKKHQKVIAEMEEWPYYKDKSGWLPADQYEELEDEQLPWSKKIIKYQTADFLKSLDLDFANIQVHGDLVYLLPEEQRGRPYGKILMPKELRQEAIKRAHGIGHYGQRKTRNKVAQEYFWRGLAKDVCEYVKACPQCQRNKAIRAPRRDYLKFPVTNRLKTLHIDIVGPLPPDGNKTIHHYND